MVFRVPEASYNQALCNDGLYRRGRFKLMAKSCTSIARSSNASLGILP